MGQEKNKKFLDAMESDIMNADIPETFSSSNETVLRLTFQNVKIEISNQATQSVIQNTLSALRCLC